MKLKILLVLFLGITPFVLAGTKEDIEQVQRNVLELQRQFWDLQKDLKANNGSIQDAVRKFQASSDDLKNNQASLNAKLESILNQVQALNEKLDETNRRLNEISSTPVRPGVPPEETGGSNQNTVGANEGTAPRAGPGNEVAGSVGEKQLFQAAMAQYSEGKSEQALRGFQDLLDQYPNSPLADDAQYMIGESYYGMKEYVDAVTEYDKVIKRFPDSPKVPGAELKKAFSLLSLGKKGQAVIELQKIIADYPNAKEAQMARQQLAKLGLD